MSKEMIDYISTKANLKVLIEDEVVHFSAEKGRTTVKNARYALFNNGWYSHPADDEAGIKKLDEARDCQRFVDASKVIAETGEVTREVVNEDEWLSEKDAVRLVGTVEELKKMVSLGVIKQKKSTAGKKYNARQINDLKLNRLGIST